MKVLTRYILMEFLKPFLLAVFFFCAIVLIVQIFNDINLILDCKPSLWAALKYFFFWIPGLVIQIVPIACLFGVLFSLSMLSKGSELIAMRAGGVDIYRVTVPLFFAGVVICVSSILFSELAVPKAEALKRRTRSVEIQKQSEASVNKTRQNISLVGAEGQIYHIGAFDGGVSVMTDVLVLQFGPDNHLQSRLDAQTAKFVDGQWVFFNGYRRIFDETGLEVSDEPFERMPIPLPEKPADFLKEQKEPEELNVVELTAYIRQLKHNGSDYHKELVVFYKKFASPFGCVILVILGIPWGWSMRKYGGVMVSFGICLLVAFIYVGGMQIGQGLGNSGVIPPFWSMWVVNVIFALVGPMLLVWKNK